MWRSFLLGVVGLVGLAGCVVMAPPAQRARWSTTGNADLEAGCVLARAFVRKTGKDGFGLAVQLRSRGDCSVELGRAVLVFPDGARLAVNPGQPRHDLTGHSLIYAWVPIEFDNNAAWNAEHNLAVVEIAVTAGAAHTTWKIPVAQSL